MLDHKVRQGSAACRPDCPTARLSTWAEAANPRWRHRAETRAPNLIHTFLVSFLLLNLICAFDPSRDKGAGSLW